MNVVFELQVLTSGRDAGKEVEYVRVDMGKEVVHRRATDEDRHRWKHQYQAFLSPPPVKAVAKPAPEKPVAAKPKEEASPVEKVVSKVFGKRK